jgi:hypothetical protein
MKFALIAFMLTLSIGASAQNGARVPDIKVKKTTGVVKHTPYTSFYQTGYRNLNTVLSEVLTDYGCQTKANIKVIKEPGLFSKGEFIGSFEASCYNPTIKDINVYFEVYPYDEESAAVVEVVFKNGSKKVKADCWNFQGKDLKCSAKDVLADRGFNFN